MRALVLLVAACEASAAPLQLHGVVIDDEGPAPGVDVALFALAPAACPCPDAPPITTLSGEVVERIHQPCGCPEALAVWHGQLARCEAPPIAHVRSDARGRFALPRIPRATLIAATRRTGESWVSLPSPPGLAIELVDRAIARVKIRGNQPATRAAILYPDGHCVPLVQIGPEWRSRRTVSKRDDGVVFAEGPAGFGVIDWTPASTMTDDLTFAATTTLRGGCTRPNLEVQLEGPYQRLVGRADATGAFQLDGVHELEARVTCRDTRGLVIDEFLYMPEIGITEDVWEHRLRGPEVACTPLEIVDAWGKPIAAAQVSGLDPSEEQPDQVSYGGITDADGRACVKLKTMTIDAPVLAGGACAGHRELTLADWFFTELAPLAPVRIELGVTALPRTSWHGRVVTPEQLPVVNARVRIAELHRSDGCGERIEEEVYTGLDGSFALPALPTGVVTIEIIHPWYLKQQLAIDNTAPPRDLELSRGARWRGQIFDPDGKPIEHCSIWIGRGPLDNQSAECGPRGALKLDALAAGDTEIRVTLSHHRLGEYRTWTLHTSIQADEARVENLRWPRGAPIAGRTVDADGSPVPHVRLRAVPKGESMLVNGSGGHEVSVISDASGRFELPHMPPGVWMIASYNPPPNRGPLEVPAGTTDVIVVVAP